MHPDVDDTLLDDHDGRAVTGADRHRYRVDTYIVQQSPPSGRPLKLVTVVVRDYLNPSLRPYARQSSTFDQSTG